MLIYNILFELLTTVVNSAPLPALARAILLKGLELAITPDGLKGVEQQGKDLLISLITKVEDANPPLKGTLELLKSAIQSAAL